MTDQLHELLADALRAYVSQHDDPSPQASKALAAYDAANKEPAKRVKLPKVTRDIETLGDYRELITTSLKEQGVEVEQ